MARSGKRTVMTVKQYLEFEETSSVRHEFVDGLIFAMSGVTVAHNLICGNLFALLHRHLRGGTCRVFFADMKVRVETTNSFYYPDIMVSCEKYRGDSVYRVAPSLIVEVLSRSTQSIDRREKFFAYKQLESLSQYVLVSQKSYQVEVYRRSDDGVWSHESLQRGDTLLLNAMPDQPFECLVEEIYENVSLPYRVKEEEGEYVWSDKSGCFELAHENAPLS